MKTNLLKSVVLMASLAATLSPASAETLHARIPFGFSASGLTMPAGAYTIRTNPNAPSVLIFENEATKAQAIVFARRAIGTPGKAAAPLIFSAGSSELTSITATGWAYEISMYTDRGSPKDAALALASSGK